MEEPTPSKVSALAALKARRTQSSNLAQPPQQQQLEAAVGQQDPVQARPKTKGSKTVQAHSWVCTMCQQECIPIRTESRCLCGHRMKEHDKPGESAGGKCRCKAAKCTCAQFFYIVAEGSWILHCSCKHKHVDHDPVTHACRKPNCKCAKFFSPWVCNCDHPWSAHQQIIVERQYKTVEEMVANAVASTANEVNPHHMVARGRDAE